MNIKRTAGRVWGLKPQIPEWKSTNLGTHPVPPSSSIGGPLQLYWSHVKIMSANTICSINANVTMLYGQKYDLMFRLRKLTNELFWQFNQEVTKWDWIYCIPRLGMCLLDPDEMTTSKAGKEQEERPLESNGSRPGGSGEGWIAGERRAWTGMNLVVPGVEKWI